MTRSSVLAVPSLAANNKRRSCGPRLPERILCAIALTAVASLLLIAPTRGAVVTWDGDLVSIDWDAIDGKPANFIFLILTSDDENDTQLQILAAIVKALSEPETRHILLSANSVEEVWSFLRRYIG